MSILDSLSVAVEKIAGRAQIAWRMREPAKLASDLALDMVFNYTVFGDKGEFPVDAEGLIRRIPGMAVSERTDLPHAASGAYTIRRTALPALCSIEFDAKDAQADRRVRAARALGQYIWLSLKNHDGSQVIVDCDGEYLNATGLPRPNEHFVAAFAQSLLVPDFELARLRSEGKTTAEIVAHFGVPLKFGLTALGESLLTRGNECTQRGFIHLKKAWYSESVLRTESEMVDEVTLGLFDPEGDMDGGLNIRWSTWVMVAGRPSSTIVAAQDNWAFLASLGDVLWELATLDSKTPTPEQVIEILKIHGFSDMTPRERGERPTPGASGHATPRFS